MGDFAMKKRIFSIVLIISLCFSLFLPVNAFEITSFEVPADAAVLISMDTNEVIYGKNTDKRVCSASMVQIMTAVVAMESIPDVNSHTVTMSETAYRKILGTGVPVLQLSVGEVISGRDALAAMLIGSKGDAIYALCESVAGDVESFVKMMNDRAAAMGLKNTYFADPIGIDDANYTTVNDIVTLTRYAIDNFPLFTELINLSRYTMAATNVSRERRFETTNFLVDPATNYFYKHCTGGKSGYTDKAGRCVTATASYDGYKYIAVIMNCQNKTGERTDFVTVRNLFKWAFNNFESKSVLDTTAPVIEMPVRLSADYDYVSLYPQQQLTSILPKEADNSTIIIKPTLNMKSVDAPVQKGDVLGTAKIIYAEQEIGTVNLVAGQDIESSTLLVVLDFFERIFTSTIFITIVLIIVFTILAFVLYVLYLNTKGKKKARKIKYIPYNEEKEGKLKEKSRKKRRRAGRPEYKTDDE